jgi:hypothetical protein
MIEQQRPFLVSCTFPDPMLSASGKANLVARVQRQRNAGREVRAGV